MPWLYDDSLQALQCSIIQGNYFDSNSDQEVFTFQLLGQFVCSLKLLHLLLLKLFDGLAQLAELCILFYKRNSYQQKYGCSAIKSAITYTSYLFFARIQF